MAGEDTVVTRTLTRSKRQISTSCPSRAAAASRLVTHVMFIPPNGRPEVDIVYKSGDQYANSKTASQRVTKKLVGFGFNLTKSTLLYVHAYTQNSHSDWLEEIRKGFATQLKEQGSSNHNLIFFDWSNYSRLRYDQAVSYVPELGKSLGYILGELSAGFGYNISQVHIISYSLGTHLSGLAARQASKASNGTKVGQITAIDPTGVCFHNTRSSFSSNYGLRPTDAALVVARHYDSVLGPGRAIGGLDILVNGGKNQPMKRSGQRIPSNFRFRTKREADDEEDIGLVVRDFAHNHRQASVHEAAMEREEGQNGCQEVAYACRSYSAYLAGECSSCGDDGNDCYYLNSIGRLRLGSNNSYAPGKRMYLKTGAGPFCLHIHQLALYLKQSASSSRSDLQSGRISIDLGEVRVKPEHQMPGTRGVYTALVESFDGLSGLEEATLRVVSSTRSNARKNSKLAEVLNDLDRIELNYMSRALREDRLARSMSLCSSSNSDSKLIRC